MEKMCPILTAARDIALAVIEAASAISENEYEPPDNPTPCQRDLCMWWVPGNPDLGMGEHCGVTVVVPDPLEIGDDDPFLKEREDDGCDPYATP